MENVVEGRPSAEARDVGLSASAHAETRSRQICFQSISFFLSFFQLLSVKFTCSSPPQMSQYTADVSLSTLLFTLKTLAVEVKIHYCEEVKMFIHHLLKCFPCLEAKRCCTFGVCVLERTKSNCLQVLGAAKSSRLP